MLRLSLDAFLYGANNILLQRHACAISSVPPTVLCAFGRPDRHLVNLFGLVFTNVILVCFYLRQAITPSLAKTYYTIKYKMSLLSKTHK